MWQRAVAAAGVAVFLFISGGESPLSQFHLQDFQYQGHRFHSVFQAFQVSGKLGECGICGYDVSL